jgi:hypothetical protein
MARPLHRKAHPDCKYGAANWGECDKASDNEFADWQAMQQVILAYNTVVKAGGETPTAYRKEKGLYAQLVQLIGGTREDLTNDDGNPHEGAWALRLRAAIERFKAGDIPVYCLYRPVPPATNEGG